MRPPTPQNFRNDLSQKRPIPPPTPHPLAVTYFLNDPILSRKGVQNFSEKY